MKTSDRDLIPLGDEDEPEFVAWVTAHREIFGEGATAKNLRHAFDAAGAMWAPFVALPVEPVTHFEFLFSDGSRRIGQMSAPGLGRAIGWRFWPRPRKWP